MIKYAVVDKEQDIEILFNTLEDAEQLDDLITSIRAHFKAELKQLKPPVYYQVIPKHYERWNVARFATLAEARYFIEWLDKFLSGIAKVVDTTGKKMWYNARIITDEGEEVCSYELGKWSDTK